MTYRGTSSTSGSSGAVTGGSGAGSSTAGSPGTSTQPGTTGKPGGHPRHRLAPPASADLLPELIELDERGYPIISGGVPRLAAHARRAVSACPALALRLVKAPHTLVAQHRLPPR